MRIILTVLVWFFMFSTANASELTFSFDSPSFSGQGKSSHYLTIENIEKTRKDAIKAADKAAKEKAEYLLDELGLKNRMSHKPGELSGGESQRVALARGLMNQPDMLLADEPTGNLDAHASDQLIELIRKLNKELNQTFVLVTHSQRVAGQLDRVLELVDGKVNPIDQSFLI